MTLILTLCVVYGLTLASPPGANGGNWAGNALNPPWT